MSSLSGQATEHLGEPVSALSGIASKNPRIDYVDVSRGLLVLLMFVVHAATPCTSSIRDPIQRLWVLEIATTGFAMMAGYTIGVRYDAAMNLPQPSRLWKRSSELLVVMFWSNGLLGAAKLYVTQQPDAAMFGSWFLGLLTLRTEYNISGVLLPIALLLPILPWVHSMEKRVGQVAGLVWFAAIVGFMVLLNQFTIKIEALEHVRKILLVGLGGFSVLTFLAYGVLGYINARVLQECQRMGWSLGRTVVFSVTAAVVLFAVMESFSSEQVAGSNMMHEGQAIIAFMQSEVMFLGIIGFGVVLAACEPQLPVLKPIRLLGAYALCAFVFHRFIGQSLMISLRLQGGELGTFLLMLAVISSSTYLLCIARQSIESVDAALKRLFL